MKPYKIINHNSKQPIFVSCEHASKIIPQKYSTLGLKREDIKRNLKDLLSINWIKEKRMANTMYQLNRDNEYVNAILGFFANVGYIGQS